MNRMKAFQIERLGCADDAAFFNITAEEVTARLSKMKTLAAMTGLKLPKPKRKIMDSR